MPIKVVSKGFLRAAKKLARLARRMQVAQMIAIGKEAHLWERTMKIIVARGGGSGGPFRENAPITEFLKGGSKPLNDDGDLLASINATPIAGTPGWFVGINRNVPHAMSHSRRTKTGNQMVDIAYVQEFGAGVSGPAMFGEAETPVQGIFQEVTEAQRKFFIFLKMSGLMDGVPSVGDLIWIRIPSRSFVRETARELTPGLENRVSKSFIAAMGFAR